MSNNLEHHQPLFKYKPYPKCPKCGLNIYNYKTIILQFLNEPRPQYKEEYTKEYSWKEVIETLKEELTEEED